ncbi:MAG: histidinol dehydrogenase [Microthrixaceae bacterium]
MRAEPSDAPTLLQRIDLRGVSNPGGSLPRPAPGGERPLEAVQQIIEDVRSRGDSALLELTERFDGVLPTSLSVPPTDIDAALARVPAEVRAALELAARRIEEHHRAQLHPPTTHESAGVSVRSIAKPVRSAGCYVPGGRAVYPSTLLMTAIPAKVAGVQRVAVCVPPERSTGGVAEVTLAAAAVAGVQEVYAVGGAQAVAALAYGTETIDPVEVICGPGNLYVAVAKAQVAGDVGIAAAFAGPSEVVVVADRSVAPELVAIDLMLQAEHGPDGLAWLVCWDSEVADAVDIALGGLLETAPRRGDITSTLARSGYSVVLDDPQAAIEVVDFVAPEHLELLCEGAEELAGSVHNAGAIFCGPWSPASLGDYLAGPSHVLPTHGSARFSSALGVADFMKDVHIITASPEGLAELGPATATLADAEGLDAHAESVRMRMRMLTDGEQGGDDGGA